MTRLMKNKKGFTLIELLAVIVLLAIVGVVGANLIITRLNKGKVDTFVNDYRDIVKEVSAAQIDGMEDCDETSSESDKKCSKYIDYATNDIDLKVYLQDDMSTVVVFKAKENGTFKKIDLSKYYCSGSVETTLSTTTKTSISTSKTLNTSKKAVDSSCTGRTKLPNGAKVINETTIVGIFK